MEAVRIATFKSNTGFGAHGNLNKTRIYLYLSAICEYWLISGLLVV